MKLITIKRGETPSKKNYVIYLCKRSIFKGFIYAEGKIAPTKWLGIIFKDSLPVYVGIRPNLIMDILKDSKKDSDFKTTEGNILKSLQEEFGNINQWDPDKFDVSSAMLFRYLRSVKERFGIII